MWLTPHIYSDLECFFSACPYCVCALACVQRWERRLMVKARTAVQIQRRGKKELSAESSNRTNSTHKHLSCQSICPPYVTYMLVVAYAASLSCVGMLTAQRYESWFDWVGGEGLTAGASINLDGWAGKLLQRRWGGGEGAKCDGKKGVGASYLWPWLWLGIIWNRLLPMCSLGCDWAERRWGGPSLPDAE